MSGVAIFARSRYILPPIMCRLYYDRFIKMGKTYLKFQVCLLDHVVLYAFVNNCYDRLMAYEVPFYIWIDSLPLNGGSVGSNRFFALHYVIKI